MKYFVFVALISYATSYNFGHETYGKYSKTFKSKSTIKSVEEFAETYGSDLEYARQLWR